MHEFLITCIHVLGMTLETVAGRVGLTRQVGRHVLQTRRQPYQDQRADFKALKAMRNALRWIKALVKYGRLPAAA